MCVCACVYETERKSAANTVDGMVSRLKGALAINKKLNCILSMHYYNSVAEYSDVIGENMVINNSALTEVQY